MLAQALLARTVARDIAAALARLYRARLPSPEDILDPGRRVAARARSCRERDSRPPRGEDRSAVAIEERKSSPASYHGKAASVPRLVGARRMPKRAGWLPMIWPPRWHRQE